MRKRAMKTKALALFLGLMAGAAFAQETAETGEGDTAAPPPGGALSQGQAVGPQVGDIYAREVHGDMHPR